MIPSNEQKKKKERQFWKTFAMATLRYDLLRFCECLLKRICFFFMPFSGEIPAEARDADNTRR